MKDQILESLGCVLDEKTVAFFSVTLSKNENGELIPTIVELGELTNETRKELAAQLVIMAQLILPALPQRLDQANQVIEAYVAILQEGNVERLARWFSDLSEYGWPADLVGKPDGFDALPKTIPGQPYEWNHYGSKAFYVSFLNRLILSKIGTKETLKYHHMNNLKRSRLQFEWWYLKSWISGDWS